MTVTALLNDFRDYSWRISAEFGRSIDDIIAANMPQGLGLAPTQTTTEISTVSGLETFVDTIASGYLNSIGKYYETKAKIAQLKVAAKGGLAVDAREVLDALKRPNASGLTPWLIGGGLLLAVMMMRK